MRFATERLLATPIGAADLQDLFRLHEDPAVMATLGGLRSRAETRRFLARNMRHWRRHRFGLWVFRGRRHRRFVGRAGLRRVEIGGREEVELAYALAQRCWGRGFATEMATAILARGFGRLGLTDIVAIAAPTNAASQRVMQNAGLAFEREVEHFGEPLMLFRRRVGRPTGQTESVA